MNNKWKLTTKEKESLIRDYQKGISPSQLATKYHIEGSSVYYHIKKNTIEEPKEISNPQCYRDYVFIAIRQMEEKLKEDITEDRRKRIKDTIRRYKWGLKQNNTRKGDNSIYIIYE